MKSVLFYFLLICSGSAFAQTSIRLPVAKFKTGDRAEWRLADFDDSKWPSIKTTERWEGQGYNRYDGYAWYRFRFKLTSELKQQAYWKDTLSFWLSKIDDADETFLNGVKIGKTGSFPTDPEGYQGKWDTERKYNIPADSKYINWNHENVIAVRVFDQSNGGGIFGEVPGIKIMEPKDAVKITLDQDTVEFKKYHTSITNHSKKTIQGVWTILVKNGAEDKAVQSIIKPTTLLPFKQQNNTIVIADITKRAEISSFFTEKFTKSISRISRVTPYILTPPVSRTPKINSPAVFGVRPGSPFIFKIAATGAKAIHYQAANLPAGLILDEQTGIIKGKTSVKGDYKVMLSAINSWGKAEQIFTIKVGDLIGLTPPMGWNSWNCWGTAVSSEKVRKSARALMDKGLVDYGWNYINIDDGWVKPQRDNAGFAIPNEKFGDMDSLGNWLHQNGLKFGIYSSPGPKTCGDYLGSYQHETQDASTYAKWGVDYLKYDWCSYEDIAGNDTSLSIYQKPYKIMQAAIKTQPRDIFYSLCQYGMKEVWKWGASVGGNSWRTTNDIKDTWESLKSIGFKYPGIYSYAGPGHWNDLDMLVVGKVGGWSGNFHNTLLTPDEQYTHISLWCLQSAPLLIGCDLERIDDFTLNLLTNSEVLAVDQDILGRQAQQKVKTRDYEIWVKELEDGGKAIGIFNLKEIYQQIRVNFNSLGLTAGKKYLIRDLWRQQNLGTFKDACLYSTPPHGVTFVKLK